MPLTKDRPKPEIGRVTKVRNGFKCKLCSKWIIPGQQAVYTSFGWTHITVEECATSPGTNLGLKWATDEERDSQSYFQQLQRIAIQATRQNWTFAKTMPEKPHYWIVPKTWVGEGYYDLVMATKTLGGPVKFGKTDYFVVNINEYRYWACGRREAPKEVSDLINRAVRLRYEPEPEPWFGAGWEWWRDEIEKFIVNLMTPATARVLDVGGTCPNVAAVAASGYRAIGTPQDMTRILAQVPTARMLHCEIEHFYPTNPEPFDMAIVGFGGGAQLTARDIKRLQYMTRGPVVIQIGTKVETTEDVSALLRSGTESAVGSMGCYVLEGQWQPLA